MAWLANLASIIYIFILFLYLYNLDVYHLQNVQATRVGAQKRTRLTDDPNKMSPLTTAYLPPFPRAGFQQTWNRDPCQTLTFVTLRPSLCVAVGLSSGRASHRNVDLGSHPVMSGVPRNRRKVCDRRRWNPSSTKNSIVHLQLKRMTRPLAKVQMLAFLNRLRGEDDSPPTLVVMEAVTLVQDWVASSPADAQPVAADPSAD